MPNILITYTKKPLTARGSKHLSVRQPACFTSHSNHLSVSPACSSLVIKINSTPVIISTHRCYSHTSEDQKKKTTHTQQSIGFNRDSCNFLSHNQIVFNAASSPTNSGFVASYGTVWLAEAQEDQHLAQLLVLLQCATPLSQRVVLLLQLQFRVVVADPFWEALVQP